MEDVRILGLHGKGASGPIMRAQMTALSRAAGLEDRITYVSGPLPCKPYHSLEHFFPPHKFTYHAWYDQPSYLACRQAHHHVQSLLMSADAGESAHTSGGTTSPGRPAWQHFPPSPPLDSHPGHKRSPPFILRAHLAGSASDLLSDETLGSALEAPRPLLLGRSLHRPKTPLGTLGYNSKGRICPPPSLKIPKQVTFDTTLPELPPHFSPVSPTTAANTARTMRPSLTLSSLSGSTPSTASWTSPEPVGGPNMKPYDGVVCFSQGCAVLAGNLLAQAAAQYLGLADETSQWKPRFAIFICGSRPYPARNEQYSKPPGGLNGRDLPLFLPGKLIGIPTLHLIGRVDPARLEGFRLASLCDPRTRTVIEFDGGHAPPRKRADVDRIVPAIQRMVEMAAADEKRQ